jgi:hypothetical protein
MLAVLCDSGSLLKWAYLDVQWYAVSYRRPCLHLISCPHLIRTMKVPMFALYELIDERKWFFPLLCF